MTHFNGASILLSFSPCFSITALHVLAQNPSGKNIDFRDDLDLLTVACLRTHPLGFLPRKSDDERASACPS